MNRALIKYPTTSSQFELHEGALIIKNGSLSEPMLLSEVFSIRAKGLDGSDREQFSIRAPIVLENFVNYVPGKLQCYGAKRIFSVLVKPGPLVS